PTNYGRSVFRGGRRSVGSPRELFLAPRSRSDSLNAQRFQVRHSPGKPGETGGRGSPMIRECLILGLFPAAMAFAASSDLISMTISNRLSLGLALAFFVVALVIGMPMMEMGKHVLAALLVLLVTFGFFARGWIGGGDAKLAAATALWFGFG